MFGKFFEKRRVEKALEKFVTKKAAEAIAEGRYLPEMKIKAGKVDFVLVFLRGVSAEQISERMAIVSDIAIKHNGVVEGMVSALMTITFGTHPKVQHSPLVRMTLVDELTHALGDDIKIVHGKADGHFGIFGSSKRCAYTLLVPKFDVGLGRLEQMDFGKIEEIALV
jgi:hypothetical protein